MFESKNDPDTDPLVFFKLEEPGDLSTSSFLLDQNQSLNKMKDAWISFIVLFIRFDTLLRSIALTLTLSSIYFSRYPDGFPS